MKKLLVVLLVLAFVLGSGSGFWSKPAVAHTGKERRVMLCIAEPWGRIWLTAPGPRSKSLSRQEGQALRPAKGPLAEAQSPGSKNDAPSLIRRGEKKTVPSPHWRFCLIYFYQVFFR